MTRFYPFVALLSLFSLLSGCQAVPERNADDAAISLDMQPPPIPRYVDDALLSELSEDARTSIDNARSRQDKIEDDLAKSIRDVEWALSQLDLAKRDLNVARLELGESKHRVALADRDGTSSDLSEAKVKLNEAENRVESYLVKIAWRTREVDLALLNKVVAEKRRQCAQAEVELEKAKAVQTLDRMAAKRVSVKGHEHAVQYHRTETDIAEVRANAAALRAEEARSEFEATQPTS